ncbi:hypothetical protein [Ferrimonas lipolytica]|uniref:Uncharacterized protein n=1 Tax=Ferrimonas lipolytica TaxID=2724191 RepID=A0A6H1UDL1_9GAMM|nr:hypothetical protein [Ferrimonas lipolytica]QIZ76680.1 hypothetical protein HER31_07230 [Ferrimonas lipolytica]
MMSMRFYYLDLDGIRFEGMISQDGPHIKRCGGGGMPIGEAELHYGDPIDPNWRLVGRHQALALAELNEQQLLELAAHFGLPLRTAPTESVSGGGFFTSPAFEGLRDWVKHHPTKAQRLVQKRAQRTNGWLEACQAANSLD